LLINLLRVAGQLALILSKVLEEDLVEITLDSSASLWVLPGNAVVGITR
jgi:hypothetical protein